MTMASFVVTHTIERSTDQIVRERGDAVLGSSALVERAAEDELSVVELAQVDALEDSLVEEVFEELGCVVRGDHGVAPSAVAWVAAWAAAWPFA
jgi:hypothetical protein